MIRTATFEETEYYKNIMYPLQDEILPLMRSEKFYLTGGTCLSRYYYQHRYSDDLDFFYDGNKYDLSGFDVEYKIFVGEIRKKFAVKIAHESEYFKQLFVLKDDFSLKIDMVFEPVESIGERKKYDKFYIDTKDNIAANKLTTIYQRKTFKDFVDLYYITKEYNVEKLLEWADKKIVLPDYEGAILMLVDERVKGDVLLIKDIDNQDFDDFIKQLINSLLQYAPKL